MAAAVFVVVVLFAVIAPLVLYAFVREERRRGEQMDRRSAERAARRDGDER
ncbi:hypothetical protein ACFQJD_11435 [Haloplanus sp. GCM10025708]|uniref:hypothetical protein n=1 Tax=Haloferacaceae TaxID=1644056 RepID=UPI00361EEDCC